MDLQGFDSINKCLSEVVDFMECIKQAEDFDGQKVDNSQKSNPTKKKSKASSSGDKYCLLHGPNTHPTNECKVLKEQANQMKSGKKSNGKFGNKTWSGKAAESMTSNKKDLTAFIQKQVAAGVQKELNFTEKKKCKASFDLNAFEDEDLKGFNYKEIDDLHINSDGKVSV